MLCPHCKTKDNFKQEGTSVYCVAKVKSGLGLCWYTLTPEERKKYFAEKRKHAEHKKRTEYNRVYYKECRRKYHNGITLAEIAIMKRCGVTTVKSHIKKFDLIPGTKPRVYKFNDKIFKWFPKNTRFEND